MKINFRSWICALAFFMLFAYSFFGQTSHVYANPPTPPPPSTDDTSVPDADVTFAGKAVIRANSFLIWNLQNYQWASANDQALSEYWVTVRNVVYALLLLVIFSAAVVMIVTRGGNMTVWGFVRKFLIIIVLITFSYALIRIIYQLTDIVQGFFGANNIVKYINDHGGYLLPIKFTDPDLGRRLSSDPKYDESAFVTINLLKITAITYYVMGCVLLVRKIILWFFLIISPVFPLLILYMPLKNTAKIWIGEFFRWLLYAPLFTLFLSGLLVLWQGGISILPLNLTATTMSYPTAIDIFIAGPGAVPGMTNSLNYNDTFIQYVAAILMLWAVTLLPFLLLRIFLDYIATLSIEEEGIGYIKKGLNHLSMGSTPFGSSSGSAKGEKAKSSAMPSLPFQHRDVPGVQEAVTPIRNVSTNSPLPNFEVTSNTPDRDMNTQTPPEPVRKMNISGIFGTGQNTKKSEIETPLPSFSTSIPRATTFSESEKKSSESAQNFTQPVHVTIPKYDEAHALDEHATQPTVPVIQHTEHTDDFPTQEVKIDETKQI